MFMQDSERSAAVAQERGIDVGLHLNLTMAFSSTARHARLTEHLERVARYLQGRRLAQAVFQPGLTGSFEYLIAAQRDEFTRLYGVEPNRFDGHHHMHLCANVVFGRLLPSGTVMRRSFTFEAGEKGLFNRLYRAALDRILARRHHIVDRFYSLVPLEPVRLKRILTLARDSVIEVETHPVMPEEYRFLTGGALIHWIGSDLPVASRFSLSA